MSSPARMALPDGDIGRDEALAALDKLLRSEALSGSDRLCRFLSYTANAALESRSSELNQYAIAVDVFDKPPSFDPATDPIVRVEAGRLRQKLDLYYAGEGRFDAVRIVFAKRGYQMRFERLSPDGEAPTRRSSAPNVIQSDPSCGPAVALLPFFDLSPERSEAAFCDGLTVELLNLLSGTGGIRVVSLTSSSQYRDRALDIREIGQHLNADAIVEGSVRRDAEQYRIAAQLTSVGDGFVLWAGAYSLPGENCLAVQQKLADSIVQALQGVLASGG